ncbi:MAG: dihydroorotate dehydrogenase electron transfer subunit [Planctomycetes bacterium]|nr:dihydroorotate dehydrogenase electron transfer subunit [Planctomycetota bacterium]
MSDLAHAAQRANSAVQRQVSIERNDAIARDTFRVRLHCPDIAARAVPGQFVMVRLPQGNDPLLGRALAVYDVGLSPAGPPTTIDLVYLALGKLTRRLAQALPGQLLEVWGPLGNGFPVVACEHLVMVAGGVGQTPFLALAKEHTGRQRFGDPPRVVAPVKRITLCYGAQSGDFLSCVGDFVDCGVSVQLATDDGTCGYHGFVTVLLERLLAEGTRGVQVVSCGPGAMMRQVAEITGRHDVPCLVSLETPMACGLGICFTCVAKVRAPVDDTWDYRRTCVDGPVFDARSVVW